jgi:hypothetical protein
LIAGFNLVDSKLFNKLVSKKSDVRL